MARYRPKPHQCPSWSIKGGAHLDIPDGPTQWEKFLIAENLEESNIGNNSKVLKFIQKNWDKLYIPTKVLKMYGMDWEM